MTCGGSPRTDAHRPAIENVSEPGRLNSYRWGVAVELGAKVNGSRIAQDRDNGDVDPAGAARVVRYGEGWEARFHELVATLDALAAATDCDVLKVRQFLTVSNKPNGRSTIVGAGRSGGGRTGGYRTPRPRDYESTSLRSGGARLYHLPALCPPVSPACDALCRRISASFLDGILDGPPAVATCDRTSNDSPCGTANSSSRSALPRNDPLDRRRRHVADHAPGTVRNLV